MLIVCPSCATSYMVDPATLGPAGRTVRCARCKVSWFAGGSGPERNLTEVGEDVTAKASARERENPPPPLPPAAAQTKAPLDEDEGDDFGVEADTPIRETSKEVSEPAPPVPLIPETVVDAPPLAPPADPDPLPVPVIEESHTEASHADDVESYAARRQRLQARRKLKRRSTRWTAIALILFAVNVTVIGGREQVVRLMPQTASLFSAIGLPVNLRQLSFEDVKITKDTQDGVVVLIVQGTIVSASSRPTTVPRLRFAARNAAGQEIYTWTALPSRSILGPGERLDFRSRLASPPADARNVLVRFFNTNDAAKGSE